MKGYFQLWSLKGNHFYIDRFHWSLRLNYLNLTSLPNCFVLHFRHNILLNLHQNLHSGSSFISLNHFDYYLCFIMNQYHLYFVLVIHISCHFYLSLLHALSFNLQRQIFLIKDLVLLNYHYFSNLYPHHVMLLEFFELIILL